MCHPIDHRLIARFTKKKKIKQQQEQWIPSFIYQANSFRKTNNESIIDYKLIIYILVSLFQMLPHITWVSVFVVTDIVVGWDIAFIVGYLHIYWSTHSLSLSLDSLLYFFTNFSGNSTKSDQSNSRFPFRIIFMFNHPEWKDIARHPTINTSSETNKFHALSIFDILYDHKIIKRTQK